MADKALKPVQPSPRLVDVCLGRSAEWPTRH